MKTVYMMCGLPRSGKSTWVAENREDKIVISADSIRLMLHGKPFIKSLEKIIWNIFDNMLVECMNNDLDIIVDNTNFNRYMRKGIIRKAQIFDYKVVAVYISTPQEICIERAVNNGQFDLVKVIMHMNLKGSPLTLNEGIDEIIEIVNYSKKELDTET